MTDPSATVLREIVVPVGRQRMSLGAHPRLRAAAAGRVQLGHRPDVAARKRLRPDQRDRGAVHRRRTGPDACRARAPSPRPARTGVEGIRDSVANDQGWPLYLDRYQALVSTEAR